MTGIVDFLTLDLARFFHIEQKIGLVKNELHSMKQTLEFYLKYTERDIEDPAFNPDDIEERKKNYFDMLKTLIIMHKKIEENQEELLKSFCELIIFYRESKEPGDTLSWLKYISISDCVYQEIGRYVEELGRVNYKLLQIRESINPKYVPTPQFLKRYQNAFIQDFFSRYINDKILPIFKKLEPVSSKSSKTNVILHWEHTRQDSITWKSFPTKKDESSQDSQSLANGKGLESTLFLNESYWALEIPSHTPFLIHEIAHFYCYRLLEKGEYCSDENLQKFIKMALSLRRKIKDFLKFFNIQATHPEVEYVCDFLCLLFFKEAYVLSLFLELFGADSNLFLDREEEQTCSGNMFVGNILSHNTISSWIRLKVLVKVYMEIFSGKKNELINKISEMLNYYHTSCCELFPSSFSIVAENICQFEKSLANLISKHLSNEGNKIWSMETSSTIWQLRDEIRQLEKEEREIFKDKDLLKLLNNHIHKYLCDIFNGNKITLPKEVTLKCFREIPIEFEKLILIKITEELKNKTEKDAKIFLEKLKENPIPGGRLLRAVASCYFSKSSEKIECDKNTGENKNIKPSPLYELAFCKTRIDRKKDETLIIKDIKKHFIEYEKELKKQMAKHIAEYEDKFGKQIKEDIKVCEDKYKLDFYFVLGPYDFILMKKGFSAKISCNHQVAGVSDWPPTLGFPYFSSIHSLIKCRDQDSREKEEIKKEYEKYKKTGPISGIYKKKEIEKFNYIGPLSAIYQIKLEDRYNSLEKMITHLEDEILRKLELKAKWTIYSSLGWEDILIILYNRSLKDIKKVKEEILNKKGLIQRSLTQILWNGSGTDTSWTDEKIGNVSVQTLLRTRSKLDKNKKGTKEDVEKKIKDKVVDTVRGEFPTGIKKITMIPGRFDFGIEWDTSWGLKSLLSNLDKLTNCSKILDLLTDHQTAFSWNLWEQDKPKE